MSILKDITDYTHEEIVSLTDEQTEKIMQLICASQGVKILIRPEEPVKLEVKPDLKVYQWGSFVSTEKGIVELFRDLFQEKQFSIFETGYNNSTGYNCKFLIPVSEYHSKDYTDIKSYYVFSDNEYEKHKQALAKYEANKNSYDKYQEEWKANQITKHEAIDFSLLFINAHNDIEYRIQQLIKEFDKYLELAEGDNSIALRFLFKAYPDENEWINFKIKEYGKVMEADLKEPDLNQLIMKDM